jgi:hypothetical protein
MEQIKTFRIGEKVRVKSLVWYNKNKNPQTGNVEIGPTFVMGMSSYCGKVLTIRDINKISGYIFTWESNQFSWCADFLEKINTQLEFDFMEEKK